MEYIPKAGLRHSKDVLFGDLKVSKDDRLLPTYVALKWGYLSPRDGMATMATWLPGHNFMLISPYHGNFIPTVP